MERYELTIISPIDADFYRLSLIETTLKRYGRRVLRDDKESGVAKRLCYPINEQEFGRYLYYTLSIPEENKNKLVEELNYLCGENGDGIIMRYLLVRERFQPDTEPETNNTVKIEY